MFPLVPGYRLEWPSGSVAIPLSGVPFRLRPNLRVPSSNIAAGAAVENLTSPEQLFWVVPAPFALASPAGRLPPSASLLGRTWFGPLPAAYPI